MPSLSDPLFDCIFTEEEKNEEESEKYKFKTFQNKIYSCPDLAFVDVAFKRRYIFVDPSNTIPSTGARPKEKCKSLKHGSRGARSKQNIRSHSFNEDHLSRKTFCTGNLIGQLY